MVTLDEALKTANTAVLLALNAISVLVSVSQNFRILYLSEFFTTVMLTLLYYLHSQEMHKTYIDIPPNNIKEIKFPEVIKVSFHCHPLCLK